MAIIVESIVGDRAIQLGAEEFVRPMSIGKNWRKIRISVRVNFNARVGASGWAFRMGVCRGTADTFSSNNCVGWVGSTWPSNYNQPAIAGGGLFQYSSGAAVAVDAASKVGTTITRMSLGGGASTYQTNQLTANKYCINCTDIYRDPGTEGRYAVATQYCTSGQANAATDSYLLHMTAEDEGLQFTGASYQSGMPLGYFDNLPVDMDTLSIVWNRSVPTLEIANVNVVRFY